MISVQRAAAQAKEKRPQLCQTKSKQLILHGLLHFMRLRPRKRMMAGEMNRLELRLRKKLGI